MVEVGGEYGTTTGRRRRCGWFDAVATRYAARLNTVTEVIVTKLDVLSAFDVVKLSVAYDFDDRRYDHFPPNQTVLNKARPVYEELPGWREDLSGARALTDLPGPARAFLDRLEELIETPVSWVSVGPGRDEMVRTR